MDGNTASGVGAAAGAAFVLTGLELTCLIFGVVLLTYFLTLIFHCDNSEDNGKVKGFFSEVHKKKKELEKESKGA